MLPSILLAAVVSQDTISRTVQLPTGTNVNYPVSVKGLLPTALGELPVNAVKAKGWLKKQMELETEGFTGRLEEISRFLRPQNNAWLAKDGKGINGWEEVPYWLRGYAELGWVLGDKKIITNAEKWLKAIMASQRENGWFGPESNLTASNGKPDIWPNMMVLDICRSWYEQTEDPKILDFMEKYFRWLDAQPEANLLTGYWEHQRGGDNIGSIAWFYARRPLDFLPGVAAKIHRRTNQWDKSVVNWHGVNFSQGFREPAQYGLFSKDPKNVEAPELRFREMVEKYGQVAGGLFATDENAREGYNDPRQATETCTMVETIVSCGKLAAITGNPDWIDRAEDIAFNSLPAAWTADCKALRYLTSPNQVISNKKNKAPSIENGGPMFHFDPADHRCCQHNTGWGWPSFTRGLWMATADNGLACVTYVSNEITAKAGKGATAQISVDGNYPFSETVNLSVKMSRPEKFPLVLRVPKWCEKPGLKLNGKTQKLGTSGAWITINREWKTGDKIELSLPQPLKIKTWEKNKNAKSVYLGPLAFSLKIKEDYVKSGGTTSFPSYEVFPKSAWNYGLLENTKLTVKRSSKLSVQPFTHEGAPITITAQGKKINEWGADYLGVVGKLQTSPVKSQNPTETLELIPMGAARLRISVFPFVNQAGTGTVWKHERQIELIPASSSKRGWFDSTDALSDDIYPGHQFDGELPEFSWGGVGTSEWVQYDLPQPRKVSKMTIRWNVARDHILPAKWTVKALVDGKWIEVFAAQEIARDGVVTVPVDCGPALKFRIEAVFDKKGNSGIWEWKLE